MKTIRFASSNPEKINEITKILSEFDVKVIPIKMNLREIRSENQQEIAKQKAISAFSFAGKPVIAEDTGIYFEAYENFPGTLPAFIFNSLGYEGILRLLERKERAAYFKTVLAFYDGRNLKTFSGICRGEITLTIDAPKFRNPKLPYEAIFKPAGRKARFSRMTKTQKAEISHRANATIAFAKWFTRK